MKKFLIQHPESDAEWIEVFESEDKAFEKYGNGLCNIIKIEDLKKGCGKFAPTPDMSSSCGDITFSNKIIYCNRCIKLMLMLENSDIKESIKEGASE